MRGSSWRSVPAAALRGLAKGALPSSSSRSLTLSKSAMRRITSARSARKGGTGASRSESRSGTAAMVRTLAVTPSPRTPSPRVAARVSTPSS